MCCCANICIPQTGAEQIMKNVAKRMLNNGMAAVLIAWNVNWKNHVRLNRIMKRVGGRWRNLDLSNAFTTFRDNYGEDKAQRHAQMIMRRVGARMRNKEMAINFAEFVRNAKNDRENMWRNRCAKMQAEIDAMQLQFTLKTQVTRRTNVVSYVLLC